MLASDLIKRAGVVHTRIGNLDLDHAPLERLAIQSESLLQSFEVGELDIAETLGALELSVLNDTDAGDIAALEELGHCLDGGIVREVSKMGSVRRLIRESLRGALANGESCNKAY